MGGGGDTTTTTKKFLPPWQEAQFKKYILEAGKAYEKPLRFYPESTVGQRDRLSTVANEMTADLPGQEYRTEGKNFLTQTLRGDFMDEGNPYLDRVSQTMAENTTRAYQRGTAATTASRFAGAGRGYSDAADMAFNENEKNLGRALYEGESNLRYGDYNNRMKERLAALGLMPQMQGMDVVDINQTRAQGAIEEDYSQRLLDDSIKRFQFYQQEPESRLDRFGARVSGETMAGQTTTGPAGGPSPGLSIGMSILSAAATVAGSFFGGAGAAIGPMIGGLASVATAGSGGGGVPAGTAGISGGPQYIAPPRQSDYGYGIFGGGR